MDDRSCRADYWSDSSAQSWGDDNRNAYGADDADVLFIHTHGFHAACRSGNRSVWKEGTLRRDITDSGSRCFHRALVKWPALAASRGRRFSLVSFEQNDRQQIRSLFAGA